MVAGYELDERVAMKVMGFVRIVTNVDSSNPKPLVERWLDTVGQEYSSIPPFSTDKSAAMKVVKRFDEIGGDAKLGFERVYEGFRTVLIGQGANTPMMHLDPFKICVAALSSIGDPDTRVSGSAY